MIVIKGYYMGDGAKAFEIEMPQGTTAVPGCLMYKGRHFRYYGYGVPKHIYLETPCGEIGEHGHSGSKDQDRLG